MKITQPLVGWILPIGNNQAVMTSPLQSPDQVYAKNFQSADFRPKGIRPNQDSHKLSKS